MTAAPATPRVHTSLGRLSFARVLRAEWIKLRTLRSTFWTLGSVIVLVVGFSALLSASMPSAADFRSQAPEAPTDQFVLISATTGLTFAQLVIAILGVLAISGEFSTGMIRSSLAAVPRRFPVLAAKALTLFLVSFVVGLISFAASWSIAVPLLSAKGFKADLFADSTLWAILGAAVYLGLVSVFALGVGTIVKSSAGGIAAALGVLFVLPIIASIAASLLPKTQWIVDAQQYLMSASGTAMAGHTNGTFEPWQSVLTVVVWTAVAFGLGAVLLQRRDA